MAKSKKINVLKRKPVKVLRPKVSEKRKKHISRKKAVKVQRAHSRKHVAPSQILELIELVNPVPDRLPPSWWLQIEVDRRASAASNEQTIHFLKSQLFGEAIEKLPPKLQKLVGAYPVAQDWATALTLGREQDEVMARYDFLVEGREVLTALSEGRLPMFVPGVSRALSCSGAWDEEERLEFEFSPLAKIVRRVERYRIGKCPMCGKFYWAERIDQPTCSTPCNNRRRSRIQRGTYVEQRPHLLKKKASKQKAKKHGS